MALYRAQGNLVTVWCCCARAAAAQGITQGVAINIEKLIKQDHMLRPAMTLTMHAIVSNSVHFIQKSKTSKSRSIKQ